MKAILQRYNQPTQTIGVFKLWNDDGKLIFQSVSMELPDLNNQQNISCIPTGSYVVEKDSSPSQGLCFHIRGVVNRSNILIHTANYAYELRGCIALGSDFGDIDHDGKIDIKTSRPKVQELESVCDKFTLTIM